MFLASIFEGIKKDTKGAVDLGVIITIGIVFAGLMVIAYIIWTLKDQLNPTGNALNSITNVTNGFDDFVNLILIVITVFILALAIAALYMIYNRRQ